MPGSTLPNTGVVQGSISGDSGTWGTIVNNALANYDAHDHTSGKGLRIKTAAINIDGDLSFGSSFAPTNLQRVSFASVAALSSNNKSLFVNSADNELYWRSNAGSNVKLTAGAALNVAAFTGGIGGDYAAVGAVVAFDDSGDRYTFKQNSPGFTWARLASGEVRIFETGSTDAVFIGLAAPAALASSYTATWPTALPGSTSIVQIASTGDISFSNTVANAATFSALITASAGLTAAANQHVTVSGTGKHKHGDRTLTVTAAQFIPDTPLNASGPIGPTSGQWNAFQSPNNEDVFAWLPLPAGARVRSIVWRADKNGVANNAQFTLVKFNNSNDTGSVVNTTAVAASTAGAADYSSTTIDYTIEANTGVQLHANVTSSSVKFLRATVTYDEP